MVNEAGIRGDVWGKLMLLMFFALPRCLGMVNLGDVLWFVWLQLWPDVACACMINPRKYVPSLPGLWWGLSRIQKH